ncbi:UDP-N-acetylmuramoyl-tripeptide--D-alanyl-D-alanine ligase [Ruminococcaceae bacterium OttesenSCG-928-I18]|nr:UDP-N-acetylmuramoyl-tripeptide--D-alanyl-D-alanine ligase [Ruminococcaceae bacterium OttesenSCG-928-I18]
MQPITAKALFKDLWPTAPAGVVITSVVTDSRQVTPGCVFVAIKGERVDGHDYARKACESGAAFVVARHTIPDVPPDRTVLVADVLDAMITMGANYRAGFSPLILGVTGSVGKTTTKEFSAAVFSVFGETLKTEGNQNNEIGMPNTLFRLDEETRYAVIEMGMQGPGEIRKLTLAAKPHGAIITKIGRAHMDRLGSVEAILNAKMEICAGLPPGAPLILNGDDPLLRSVALPEGIHAVYAALEAQDAEVHASAVEPKGAGQRFRIIDRQFGEYEAYIPALGEHTVADALLAYTAATRLGLNAAMAADGLASFRPAEMRQHIRKTGGVTLIEDYYNANPDSMKAALSLLASLDTQGRRVAVLGDMLELGEASEHAHRELGNRAATLGVQLLVTVGKQASLAAAEASSLGVQVRAFDQNEEAADFLHGELQKGDTLLLKASRGMKFEDIAKKLG